MELIENRPAPQVTAKSQKDEIDLNGHRKGIIHEVENSLRNNAAYLLGTYLKLMSVRRSRSFRVEYAVHWNFGLANRVMQNECS